jgi:DNA-3-methyladenine glycosylase
MNGTHVTEASLPLMAKLSSISFRDRLDRGFFNQPTLQVAQDLLGKLLVRSYRGRLIAGVINETEAYLGPADRAAHSYLHPEKAPQRWQRKFEPLIGRHTDEHPQSVFTRWATSLAKITPRNIAEYLEGGHVYIYQVYGMHWQLNLSTAGEGLPECVLIRSVIPVRELPGGRYETNEQLLSRTNGPGKLCEYFRLDKSFYAEDVTVSDRLWVEDIGATFPRRALERGPRIGINYAGEEWAAKPWRFLVKPEKVQLT